MISFNSSSLLLKSDNLIKSTFLHKALRNFSINPTKVNPDIDVDIHKSISLVSVAYPLA